MCVNIILTKAIGLTKTRLSLLANSTDQHYILNKSDYSAAFLHKHKQQKLTQEFSTLDLIGVAVSAQYDIFQEKYKNRECKLTIYEVTSCLYI